MRSRSGWVRGLVDWPGSGGWVGGVGVWCVWPRGGLWLAECESAGGWLVKQVYNIRIFTRQISISTNIIPLRFSFANFAPTCQEHFKPKFHHVASLQ